MTMSLLASLNARGEPSLHDIARGFASVAGATGAIIHLSDGHELTVGGAYPRQPDCEARLQIPLGQGVAGSVALHGHALRLGADRPRTADHRRLLGIDNGGEVARMCLPARGLNDQILGVVAIHRATDQPFTDDDVTERQPLADVLGLRLQAADLMNAVDAHRHDRERLIAHAISAQEAERRRIAMDLHDGVTTALASMQFHLNAADLGLPEAEDGAVRSQITAARSLADLAYTQTRAAITGLHSLVLDDLGLVAAVESLVETTLEANIELRADDASAFDDLPDHAATALFRIAQETVSNAVRHAEASSVVVTLRRTEDSVVLGTTDDGRGFEIRQPLEPTSDDGAAHFGLSSLAERSALIGASLRIESMPGRGTTVIVEVPVGVRR